MPLAIEDVLAIQALYARYNQLFDDFDREGWLDLFTDDTVRSIVASDGQGGTKPPTTLTGRAALEEYWDSRQSQYTGEVVRHLSSDLLIDGDGDTARGSVTSMVVYYSDGTPKIMNTGRMVDDLVKQGDTWRFKCRAVTADGLGGVGGGAFDAKS
jgi:hypothetical protein